MLPVGLPNPYQGLNCVVMIKSQILFKGKWTAPFLETKIIRWFNEGLVVEDGSFLPWSNISSVGTMDRDYLAKIAKEADNVEENPRLS